MQRIPFKYLIINFKKKQKTFFYTVPLTALVIARDVALIAAVFYVRYKTVPPPVSMK